MQEPPLNLLSALASIDEQRRHIVHATKESYLTPEDVLNDAHHFCERAQREETASKLDQSQREAVTALEAALGAVNLDGFDRTNIGDLIERDARWSAARRSALETVTAFGRRPLV